MQGDPGVTSEASMTDVDDATAAGAGKGAAAPASAQVK